MKNLAGGTEARVIAIALESIFAVAIILVSCIRYDALLLSFFKPHKPRKSPARVAPRPG